MLTNCVTKKIVGDLTEFHVLVYMCRPENWRKFKQNFVVTRLMQNLQYPNSVMDPTDPRDGLLSDVEEIMKFFLKFRINLFSIMQNKVCPDDIKAEFSSKITEMGKTIHPFMEKHRQDVIERVLNYFVSAATAQEHGIPCALVAATVQEILVKNKEKKGFFGFTKWKHYFEPTWRWF